MCIWTQILSIPFTHQQPTTAKTKQAMAFVNQVAAIVHENTSVRHRLY